MVLSREEMLSPDFIRAITRQRKQMSFVQSKEKNQDPMAVTTGERKFFFLLSSNPAIIVAIHIEQGVVLLLTL